MRGRTITAAVLLAVAAVQSCPAATQKSGSTQRRRQPRNSTMAEPNWQPQPFWWHAVLALG
jgi:hypothetical protein